MVRLRCGLDEAAVIEVRSEAFPFLLDRMLCRLRLCVLLFPGDWVFLEHAHRCAVTGASWVTTRFNSLHTTVSAPRRSSTTWRTSPRAGALCTAIFWIAHAVQSLRLAVSRRLSFAGACSQMVGQCCFVGHETFQCACLVGHETFQCEAHNCECTSQELSNMENVLLGTMTTRGAHRLQCSASQAANAGHLSRGPCGPSMVRMGPGTRPF